MASGPAPEHAPEPIDAEIDLGFGITTVQRIRLAGVQAPELTRRGQVCGDQAYEACLYVNRRLIESTFQVELISSRMGKWRRWIGTIGRIVEQYLDTHCPKRDII